MIVLKLQEVAILVLACMVSVSAANCARITGDAWNQLPEEYQNAIQMRLRFGTSEQLSRYSVGWI